MAANLSNIFNIIERFYYFSNKKSNNCSLIMFIFAQKLDNYVKETNRYPIFYAVDVLGGIKSDGPTSL